MGVLEKWSCTTCVLLGTLVRLVVAQMKPVVALLMTRVELQTPATSWESMEEGMYLYQKGVSPYQGSIFHNQPFLLKFFTQIQTLSQLLQFDIAIVFLILCDVMTAYSLFKCCETYLSVLREKEKILSATEYDKEAYERFNIEWKDPETYAKIVTLAFLLNPFSVTACVCKTTLPIEMVLYARSLLFCLRKNSFGAIFSVSMASYLFFFPVLLWAPVCYVFCSVPDDSQGTRHQSAANKSRSYLTSCINWTVMFISIALCTTCLFLVSYYICNYSWDFFQATWGFHYNIPDLQPNVGLHWYFYMEMFDQYRAFFIAMIHSLSLLICIPLCWKFNDDRIIPVYSAIFFIAIYKSYPSFADLSLCLSLIPMVGQCFALMKNLLFLFLLFCTSYAALPVMYHVWVVTFNPNFFYAITLIYGTVQMLLWSDLIFSINRRQFLLRNGLKYPEDENGSLKRFCLN